MVDLEDFQDEYRAALQAAREKEAAQSRPKEPPRPPVYRRFGW